MAKIQKNVFNVLRWDLNTDKPEHFDVLPGFRDSLKQRSAEWKKHAKSKRFQKYIDSGQISKQDLKRYYEYPETFDDLKEFIKNESQYMYWAKCEYEMIVHGWPVQKGDYKIDVHEQVMMNLQVITELLWDELNRP